MREPYFKVCVVAPLQRSLASFPFHGVRLYSVDWAQSHLVQLALGCHAFDVESQGLATPNALHTKVEPSMIVTFRCVW